MNKYEDEGLLRRKRLNLRLTEEEMNCFRKYQQQARAPSLSIAVREAALTEAKRCQNGAKTGTGLKENKESNKENKEKSLSLEKNALTHAQDLNFYISWITDDERLRPYAEEFVRGLLAAGEDLEKRGAADLRRHFRNWLPKYQAKREIDSRKTAALEVERKKPDYQIDEQMLMKRRREEQAAELQRKLDAQKAEAEDAGDARAAFFAKRLNYQKERKKDEIL